jgi:dipeptidase D
MDFQKKFLEIFSTLPNGVAEFAPEYGVPRTSSNLAILKNTQDNLHLILSARSLDDKKRKQHTDNLVEKLSVLLPQVKYNSEYPGWTPDTNSKLPEMICRLRKELFNKESEIEVIHAGLEAGLFAGKNPHLQMVSISPDSFDIHTVNERVSISSVQEFYTFFSAFLNKLA